MKRLTHFFSSRKFFLSLFCAFTCLTLPLFAQQIPGGGINLDVNSFIKPGNFSQSVSLLLALSSISFIPFFLISSTCFLRIVIVFGMLRSAIGTPTSPPNPVILSLALFLTIFVMTPTFNEINTIAVQPYQEGRITQKEAIELGVKPFKDFMLRFTREKDLALFLEFSHIQVKDFESVPMYVLIPSYIISELKTAFQIGFLLFIPFIVIDLIVSNILLSLGMFMLSPAMISLPFKILLFVLTDGWALIIRGLLVSLQPR